MKHFALAIFMFFEVHLYAQELNLGAIAGIKLFSNNGLTPNAGAVLEYRLNKAIFSINNEFQFTFANNELIFTYPLYLKWIIGNNFRFCPSMGGFIRSNSNYGWLAGAGCEYRFTNKWIFFLKADLMIDYHQETMPLHSGGSGNYTIHDKSYWLAIGFKRNVLKSE